MTSNTIDILTNPGKIQVLTQDLINSAKQEIMVIFSTSKAFHRQERAGSLLLARHVARSRNVRLRILTPFDDIISQFERLPQEDKNIEIRSIEEESQIKVSLLIVDRNVSLAVELKDDTRESSLEAIGHASYSNSAATVLSYASFFETLWNQSALYEKLKIHDRLQNEFITMAAHELRTPIQPVLALSQHLLSQDSILDSNQRQYYLDIIVRNATRLQQLTEDILDSTKIEMHSLQLKYEDVDIHDVVLRSVRDAQERLAKTVQFKLNLEFNKNETNTVKGDRRRLAQVMANLLNNSIKFTSKGNIDILVRREQEDDKFVLVQVKDTGSGIDPQMMDKLFTKFSTGSLTGTGLGLYISRGIIEAHGGSIWAENNSIHKGAIITFKLPLVRD